MLVEMLIMEITVNKNGNPTFLEIFCEVAKTLWNNFWYFFCHIIFDWFWSGVWRSDASWEDVASSEMWRAKWVVIDYFTLVHLIKVMVILGAYKCHLTLHNHTCGSSDLLNTLIVPYKEYIFMDYSGKYV